MSLASVCCLGRIWLPLCLLGATSVALAGDDAAWCKQIRQGKMPQAYLLDEAGDTLQKTLELGTLEDQHSDGDFFHSQQAYRLVLYPAHLTLADDYSLAHCVLAKKTAPHCAGTAELIVHACVNPLKFGPGKFVHEAQFRLADPQRGMLDADQVQYGFDRKLRGQLALAWLEVVQPKLDAQFFAANPAAPAARSMTLLIHNRGDRALQLGSWRSNQPDALQQQGEVEFALQAGDCENRLLAPQQRCRITVHRKTAGAARQGVYSWSNDGPGEQINTLYLEKFSAGDWRASIANRRMY